MALFRKKEGAQIPSRSCKILMVLLRTRRGAIRSDPLNAKHVRPLKQAGIVKFVKHSNSNLFSLTLTRQGAYLKKLFDFQHPDKTYPLTVDSQLADSKVTQEYMHSHCPSNFNEDFAKFPKINEDLLNGTLSGARCLLKDTKFELLSVRNWSYKKPSTDEAGILGAYAALEYVSTTGKVPEQVVSNIIKFLYGGDDFVIFNTEDGKSTITCLAVVNLIK